MEGDGSPPERKPPRGFASPGSAPARRYSRYVGLAFVAVIVVAGVSSISSQEGELLGTDPNERGAPLAPFAVPEALGPLTGDANIFQDDCETSRNPCPADDRRMPACEVEGEDVIRVCDLFDRPLVLSFWFTRGGDCLPTQDVVDEMAARYGDRVNFLSINVRDDREEVREIIEERGWELRVGYDADGAVSGLYRVGVCPTVAFAYPGGILAGAAVGASELGSEAFAERIEELERESRARARESR
jgi:thiol-disulfide isomerase/thioredoxin